MEGDKGATAQEGRERKGRERKDSGRARNNSRSWKGNSLLFIDAYNNNNIWVHGQAYIILVYKCIREYV